MTKKKRVLIVDDHAEMARLLSDQLSDAGFETVAVSGGLEATQVLSRESPDLVITDLKMKDVDGLDVLGAARRCSPPVPVLVMTAFGGISTAVEAIKRGASHYFTKPFALDDVLVLVRRALDEEGLRAENHSLRTAAKAPGRRGVVGPSKAMRELHSLLARLGPSQAAVLIRGESGTGKELIARALHDASLRRGAPFVAVNCSAFPATLLESELFGHVRGAFTGATGARRGLFVEADGGTLFLDEIGDMPADLQSRMLRVLQDGVVRPVGADQSRPTDVRIIAATHQDLEAGMKDGRFRSDLFYRLNVVNLRVPPLRARVEDIAPLVDHFILQARARTVGVRVERVSSAAPSALESHPWPGNVRELENLVERLCLLVSADTIERADVEAELGQPKRDTPIAAGLAAGWTLRQLETAYIAAVLEACDGNKSKAAELLGVDASTLHRRERTRIAGEPG